jgi:hypothetical protein
MAYSLRYWYNNKLTDGKVIRLEIYKKDSTAAAMEIGDVVQGLSLNIDGGEDNIDAPIVSTSLVMTFCDAYDHPEADVKKCGNYAEFYTPDATLWKVVLLCKDAGASSFRTLWGGYVTPDSYEEDLTYRGSVTIVARDNIGHMADFPFDAEGDDYGTISFREIIEGAWAKIESPMSLVFHDEWMQTEGVSALDTRMNVSAFEDKSWHEAVEAALYAYGAVLRFIGDNEVKASPLRYMPNYGGSVTHSEPVFMTGATRMLTPAVKKIEETASYELESELQPLVKPSDFSGNNHALDAGNEIYGYSLSNTEEGKGWFNTTDYNAIYFDPSAYNILEADSVADIKNQMYIVANVGFNYKAEYSRYVSAHNAQIKISFGTGLMRKRYTDASGKPIGGYYLVPRAGKIMAASYSVSVTQNGVTQYLDADGEWTTTSVYKNFTDENGFSELNIPIDLSDYTGTILLKVEIGGLDATIPYVQIAALSFGANEKDSLLQTNRVNTNYNEDNNVIITRDPAIAPAYNTTFLPSVIKNGIFYAEGLAYKPAKAWAFAGDTPQQMAVYNHLQLLAYYAKPNNVIEGSIVNGDVSRFAHIWQFEGKEHILVSGRYNFINGYIEGAILREFARYESLWGSTGGTQLPATETSNETNVEASASSSSSANTYDNTTNVYFGGGGGESLIKTVLGIDDFNTVTEEKDDVTFNAYAIDSLYKSIKTIEGNITTLQNNKADANKVYTITQIDNLFSQVDAKFTQIASSYLSVNGGQLHGSLRLRKGTENYGMALYFGDGDYCYLMEDSDDHLKINASKGVAITTSSGYALSVNGYAVMTLADLDGYATQSWVENKGYLTSSSLSGYATQSWVNQQKFATQSWVQGLGYATQSWVENKGYLTNAALSGYLPKTGGTISGNLYVQGDITCDGDIAADGEISGDSLSLS